MAMKAVFEMVTPNEISKMYLTEGLSVLQISRKTGWSRGKIYDTLKKKGASFQYRKEIDLVKLNDMYIRRKMSTQDVATELGLSQRTVYLVLKSLGLIDKSRKPKHSPMRVFSRIDTDGYRTVFDPIHPNATKYGWVLEHRKVMSDFIGRPLDRNEVVHHKNGDRLDNRLENLTLYSSSGAHTAAEHLPPKSEDQMLNELSELYKKLNRPIKTSDISRINAVSSYETYRVRFGSFKRACELANVPRYSDAKRTIDPRGQDQLPRHEASASQDAH